jgi:ornithine cyclodeaminase/alanine dehydrogenase-like protein (mu-crystallin family)
LSWSDISQNPRGCVVVCMGSDTAGKQELKQGTIDSLLTHTHTHTHTPRHKLVCDLGDQCERVGESQWSTILKERREREGKEEGKEKGREGKGSNTLSMYDLGEVMAGRREGGGGGRGKWIGREGNEVIICDLTGVGVQDASISAVVVNEYEAQAQTQGQTLVHTRGKL